MFIVSILSSIVVLKQSNRGKSIQSIEGPRSDCVIIKKLYLCHFQKLGAALHARQEALVNLERVATLFLLHFKILF